MLNAISIRISVDFFFTNTDIAFYNKCFQIFKKNMENKEH